MDEQLPLPFVVCLAQTIAPKFRDDGTLANLPTADDDVNGLVTYTDD